MKLTSEQNAIVEYVRAGKGDLLIEAVAGSGKTASLLEALAVIPQRSILVCAFNRNIADELKTRAPKPRPGSAMHIKTFHAIGKSIVQAHFPKLTFDKNGTESIITKALNGDPFAYPLRRAAVKLLRQCKELSYSDVIDIDVIEGIGRDYDLFDKLRDDQIDEVCAVVASAYELSRYPKDLEVADFCDMIWMPVALNLAPPSRYQAIFVDEGQDASSPQFELIKRLLAPNAGVNSSAPGGRLIMALDRKQAINQWRGAVGGVIYRAMVDDRKAKVLGLTTSFRCSKAVIHEARALVPAIQAWADALEGSITRVGLCDVPRMIFQGYSDTIHTFILSRSNAPLLDTALYLWREGVRFQLNAGQEMLAPLFGLLDVLDLRTPELFRASLLKWHAEQTAKAELVGASTELLDRLSEQRDMLSSAVHYTKPAGLRRLFQSILEPGKTGVLLSTVHKVKGLEADRVFLLKQTFKRHKWEAATDEERDFKKVHPPTEEDLNIEYVAITRAKEHLIWVDLNKREIAAAPDPKLTQQLLRSLSIEGLEKEFDKAEGEMARLGATDEKAAAEWAKHAECVLAELASRK